MSTDVFRLEAIGEGHAIAAGMFVPFVINRLGESDDATESILTVHLRGIGSTTTERQMSMQWSAESAARQVLGLQANTITEWAALGVACALVMHYTALRIQEVAVPGNCFDYWVVDGEHQYGLEVTGTMGDDVESRHREKVRQLHDNPYGVAGYVVAVGFASRTAVFSFNRFEEDQ